MSFHTISLGGSRLILQVQKVSKMFATTTILSEVSMQLEDQERVGLVGVNGAGKSTLLHLITGQLEADSGHIHRAKGSTIGYLKQTHGLNEQLTIEQEMRSVFAHVIECEQQLLACSAELSNSTASTTEYERIAARYSELTERFEAIGGYAYESRIRSVLHGMGFIERTDVTTIGSLSGGQKTRLALAKLLLTQPDLLILDEPTNHLDIATLEWLENYLRTYPGAILIVSHDRYFLDAVVDVIIELQRSQTRRFVGNYTAYIEAKSALAEQELKAYAKQQEQIARLEDFVQRNIARASTTKRAQSRRKMLEQMDRLDRPQGELRKAKFSFKAERATGKDVLAVSDLGYAFPDRQPLFSNLEFQLKRGESVALLGANGTGKSTLVRLLAGRIAATRGSIRWGAGVKIGLYEQEQSSLHPHKTILDEVWDEFPQLEEVRIRSVLGHFLFSGEDAFKKISSLSGGEKARVALAKLMLDGANVLILDEPTNHLDIHSKEMLEEALFEFDGTLLFISHDRYFINRLAERVLELHAHELQQYIGDYEYYLSKKAAVQSTLTSSTMNTTTNTNTAETKQVQAPNSDKQAKRDERARQRKLAQLEQAIEELEATVQECEQQLLHEEIQQDYLQLQEISTKIADYKAQLQPLYEQWQELIE
jgi:ATP-binding cassette subfamily F protein 3